MSNLVFVYGTLKRDFGNHHVIERARGKYVGDSETKGLYSMYNLGSFPGVWLDTRTSPIYGELFVVETIEPLDMLEGYPRFYNRALVDVLTGDGDSVGAWMYFINPLHNQQPLDEQLMPSGKWE